MAISTARLAIYSQKATAAPRSRTSKTWTNSLPTLKSRDAAPASRQPVRPHPVSYLLSNTSQNNGTSLSVPRMVGIERIAALITALDHHFFAQLLDNARLPVVTWSRYIATHPDAAPLMRGVSDPLIVTLATRHRFAVTCRQLPAPLRNRSEREAKIPFERLLRSSRKNLLRAEGKMR